jgi:hypothetical protein
MNTRNRFSRSLLIVAMALAAILVAPRAPAQVSSAAAMPGPDQPKSLLITIIQGEGALNDIRTRTAREPIVEVDDENHKPVAGALVIFSLDKSGSSYANFSGVSSVSVHTDAAGRAAANGFKVTPHKGSYNIQVHASYGQLVADGVIAESNIAEPVSQGGTSAGVAAVSHKKLWIVSSVLAAGAVAGILVATRQSSPTSVSAGTGTVGAPAATGGIRLQLHPRHP